MVFTRATTSRNGGNNNEDPDLVEIISAEVREALQQILPGLFEQIMTELRTELEESVAAMIATARNGNGLAGVQTRASNIRDFKACQPPFFEGKKDPLISMRWISEVEGAFRTSLCPEESKVPLAANLLRGAAKDWWGLTIRILTEAEIASMNWEEFKTMFRRQYVPAVEVERITKEFLSLTQTNESVNEITDKFLEKAFFCPDYVKTEEMKMTRYSSMLRRDIRKFVVTAGCTTFNEMVNLARIRELDLESEAPKRKHDHQAATSQPNKKFKPSAQQFGKKQDTPRCSKCGKNHYGECREVTCYKCGKKGHYSSQCGGDQTKMCFNCNQMGHIKANCPSLKMGPIVHAPAPASMRITDGSPKKAEVPRAQGRAFQLTVDEAVTSPDVIAGTDSYIISR